MRWIKVMAFAVILVMLGWGMYNLVAQKKEISDQVDTLRDEVGALQAENRSLTADIDYFSVPENLIKELKAQFNYREAGEELIILVPREGASE